MNVYEAERYAIDRIAQAQRDAARAEQIREALAARQESPPAPPARRGRLRSLTHALLIRRRSATTGGAR
jgi:hypothetical protein